MRSTFKILFYINRQKTKADGNTAILCRITIDGKSTAITTGEECNPSRWNSKQGLTTDRKTNQRISEFRELIEKTYRDILVRDGVVSAELIKNRLQGIADKSNNATWHEQGGTAIRQGECGQVKCRKHLL